MRYICIVLSLLALVSCTTEKPVPQVPDVVGNYARSATNETLTLNSDLTYTHAFIDSTGQKIETEGKWNYNKPPSKEDMKRELENAGGYYSYGAGRTMIMFYSWKSLKYPGGSISPSTVWFENGSPVIQPMIDTAKFVKRGVE